LYNQNSADASKIIDLFKDRDYYDPLPITIEALPNTYEALE